jgi:hypothetical protein
MSKGLWGTAGASDAFECLFSLPQQSPIDAQQTDDQRFAGQELKRFIQQSFRIFLIAVHHCQLSSKVDGVLVVWIFASPNLDLSPRHVCEECLQDGMATITFLQVVTLNMWHPSQIQSDHEATGYTHAGAVWRRWHLRSALHGADSSACRKVAATCQPLWSGSWPFRSIAE